MDTNISKRVAGDTELGVTKATTDESLFANWSVDIEARVANMNLASQEELLRKKAKASIYKVPSYRRELNPRAYTPIIVSFGPFHYDNPELKKMKDRKERALVQFLKRNNQSLQNVKREVAKIIAELRDAYYCLDGRWKTNDEEFLKMMILDGCFTLEILLMLQIFSGCICTDIPVIPSIDGRVYSDTDPYFNGVHGDWVLIRRDMLLIENQLPLLLLKTLVHFQTPNPEDDYINKLVLNFVSHYLVDTRLVARRLLGLHALDLYRRSLLNLEHESQSTQSELPQHEAIKYYTIRCATELHEAGVTFKKSENNNLQNMRFNSKTGKFHLPFLTVNNFTECYLLNVITFENSHVDMSHVVTAYVYVMSEIIDSANDVRLLHEKGLTSNSLGSDEEVAHIFNTIHKDSPILFDDNLFKLMADISKYCKRRRNRWRAYLIHTYFKNPWTIISLVGALLIIALTIAQTVYAAVPQKSK